MNDSKNPDRFLHFPNLERCRVFSLAAFKKPNAFHAPLLPLLIMATVTEFVILATGWKYQQVVCLPLGMGVTFFGIGPIGATTFCGGIAQAAAGQSGRLRAPAGKRSC